MIIFRKAEPLHTYLGQQQLQGRSVGFVPTMGALHQGHITLVDEARKACDLVVVSIFINPTQFNNPEDFRLYPVTIDGDIQKLVAACCDVLFLPPVEEIYPPRSIQRQYDLGSLEQVLEGQYRPGHFQGVCQVVDRLLQLVAPNHLFMGQKDFQQCMVVRKLLQLTGKEGSIRFHMVPTVREADGLAMSSRNLRLDDGQRRLAPIIAEVLHEMKENLSARPLKELKAIARHTLEEKGFAVDYIEIVHPEDLSIATAATGQLVALAAVTTGSIRLIDNLPLN